MAAHSPRHSASVAAAVVDDDDRVLAIHRRDNGHWEPPGGVPELDETIADGLRRKVIEETGLTVGPEALTGVYKYKERGIVALVFRCHVTEGPQGPPPRPLRRMDDAGDIREQMDEAYAVRMIDALNPSRPSIRSHNGRTNGGEASARGGTSATRQLLDGISQSRS